MDFAGQEKHRMKCVLLKSHVSFLVLTILLMAEPSLADNFKYRTDKRTGEVISISNRAVSPVSLSITTARLGSHAASKSLTAKSDEFVNRVKDSFGISSILDLKAKSTKTDKLGITTVRYSQTYKGVKVEGAEIIASINSNGEVTGVKGRTLKNIRINPAPKISAKRAVQIGEKRIKKSAVFKRKKASFLKQARQGCNVLARTGRSRGFSPCFAKETKRFQKLSKLKVDGKVELIVYNDGFLSNNAGTDSKLVYKYMAMSPSAGSSLEFLIDANKGAIYKVRETNSHLNRNIYDCTDPLNTDACYLDRFIASQGYTFGRSEHAPERGPVPHGKGLITEGSDDVDRAHSLAGQLYDFYQNKFGRDGGNDRGGIGGAGGVPFSETRVWTNYNGITGNPCNPGYAWFSWSPSGVAFCRGNVVNDTFAHEYSHAVSRYLTINEDGTFTSLLYKGESGALDEAFADVMGEAFESVAKNGMLPDWVLSVVRNMANPSSLSYRINLTGEVKPYPERFNDPNFYCGTEDDSGVHINSTVPSHAAYLASEGGEFNGCKITGIGLSKMEQVWYRAHTSFSPNETFNMAYYSIEQACSELANASASGNGGAVEISLNDCDNVIKALQAVEMDQGGFCSAVPARDPYCKGSCYRSPFASI